MYVNLKLFRRALYLSLFKQPFSLRRWAYIGFFTALFWVMWLIVAFGRALDHLLFPGFRRQAIAQPVFIVAPPRSGTTLTQKLLSLDDERFVHVKLYQTIFPSVCFQRCFDGVAWLDRHTGRLLSKLAGWMEKSFFGGWDGLHKLRFNEPEEDDGFFVYCFVTEAVYLLFPHVDELWEAGFPDALPVEDLELKLNVFKPAEGTSKRTAIVHLHGGGFRGGNKEAVERTANHLVERGYVCVNSQYRIATQGSWPAQIEDAKAANDSTQESGARRRKTDSLQPTRFRNGN
jgi:hypothetical protein